VAGWLETIATVPKVLVIEDDPDTRELERYALTCGGHDVVLAPNGNEGLRVLEQLRPCVILLDLMMPVMDGLTFLVERRRRRICADVPVVCVSAAGPEMATHAIRLGARECIAKPTDFDNLCTKVAQYCGALNEPADGP
jgi:CheY-like chemotaxis protein